MATINPDILLREGIKAYKSGDYWLAQVLLAWATKLFQNQKETWKAGIANEWIARVYQKRV